MSQTPAASTRTSRWAALPPRSSRWLTPRFVVARLGGERRDHGMCPWAGYERRHPRPCPRAGAVRRAANGGTADALAPLLLELDAAAAELQCIRRSLERQIAAGRITALHIGRSVRIERRELEAFAELLRTEAQSRRTAGMKFACKRRLMTIGPRPGSGRTSVMGARQAWARRGRSRSGSLPLRHPAPVRHPRADRPLTYSAPATADPVSNRNVSSS
jgi:excisionase family DNA binding protein